MSTLSQAGIDSPIVPVLHPVSVPRPNEGTADSIAAERPHDASGFFVPRPAVVLIRKDYQFAKRLLDVSVCIAIFPLVLVVIAFCGAMVWLDDRGPIFFVQSRTGRGGRRFKVYKLRTMVTNATELKKQYAHLNVLSGPDFKIKDDPRVTRAGRVIRKASLDELPQIFNVLMGNMSLVGPRPCSFDASTFALSQTERFEVLPGITGLAQVSGRSDIDFEDKLGFDVEYIQKRSFWFDVRIIFRTVGVLIHGRGVC